MALAGWGGVPPHPNPLPEGEGTKGQRLWPGLMGFPLTLALSRRERGRKADVSGQVGWGFPHPNPLPEGEGIKVPERVGFLPLPQGEGRGEGGYPTNRFVIANS